MSPKEASGMSFTSLFQFSAIPYRSGNNCPLVNMDFTRKTPGITFLARRLCLTAKKSACPLKCKQSFTEQAV